MDPQAALSSQLVPLVLLLSGCKSTIDGCCRVWTGSAWDDETQRPAQHKRANERARPRAARAQLGHAAILHWWPTARCHMTAMVHVCGMIQPRVPGLQTFKADAQAKQRSGLQQSYWWPRGPVGTETASGSAAGRRKVTKAHVHAAGVRPPAQQPPLANGGPVPQQGSMPGPRPSFGAQQGPPGGFQRGPPGTASSCLQPAQRLSHTCELIAQQVAAWSRPLQSWALFRHQRGPALVHAAHC